MGGGKWVWVGVGRWWVGRGVGVGVSVGVGRGVGRGRALYPPPRLRVVTEGNSRQRSRDLTDTFCLRADTADRGNTRAGAAG